MKRLTHILLLLFIASLSSACAEDHGSKKPLMQTCNGIFSTESLDDAIDGLGSDYAHDLYNWDAAKKRGEKLNLTLDYSEGQPTCGVAAASKEDLRLEINFQWEPGPMPQGLTSQEDQVHMVTNGIHFENAGIKEAFLHIQCDAPWLAGSLKEKPYVRGHLWNMLELSPVSKETLLLASGRRVLSHMGCKNELIFPVTGRAWDPPASQL